MANDSILIVDDTPVNLKLVRVLLSRQGFEVRTATTAEEALEIVQQFRPRLVLADIQLPGMNGLELTRRVKSDPVSRDTIVLALTAFAMKGDEEKAFAAGCDGYVTKPIDTRTFPMLIRHYLNRGSSKPADGAGGPAPERAENAPQLRDLRRTFLTEGVQQTGRLISTLGVGFDDAEALTAAQRWATTGGSIGYPEISQSARELEAVLQDNGRGSLVRKRELLVRLARLFGEAAEPQPPAANPDPMPAGARSDRLS